MLRTPTVQWISFIIVVVVVSIAFLWVLLPFYGAILWAVILAILFHPLQRRLVLMLHGNRTAAAATSVLVCICIVVIPGSLLLASLAGEVIGTYNRLSTDQFDPGAAFGELYDALPAFVTDALAASGMSDLSEIQARLSASMMQLAQSAASYAVSIGQETLQILIGLAVMLYLLFFLFRDGRHLIAMISRASPLNHRHTRNVMDKFTAVVKATVLGNIVIAVIQGTLGGITFALLGIEGAVLWGVVMAVLSLLPVVGVSLVWAPVAVYLIVTGEFIRGAILFVVGFLLISMIDNILRPILVGKGIRLPDYLVLITTLGGFAVFGANGFVIGPLIAALFVAVWSIFADDRTDTAREPATRPAQDDEGERAGLPSETPAS